MTNSVNQIQRVVAALQELRAGNPVLLADDKGREDETDIVCAAEKITPETVNFMIRNGSGIVCLALTKQKTKDLALPLMIDSPSNQLNTAFTVSIDAQEGITSGVSAYDRSITILRASHPDSNPGDFIRPGHIFPVRAEDGGVLTRAGHTEGSVDLMRLAGLQPAAALCELMNPDGSVAKGSDIDKFAQKHSLQVVSISDIIYYILHGHVSHNKDSYGLL